MRQTMTLLDMILNDGLDPFNDDDLLKFINTYWVYNYGIEENLLNKLKLMFVTTYMQREIQFPELSYSSALSPTMQWKLALTKYLREQEDWYKSLYNTLVDLDPYAFTEMKSHSEGTETIDATNTSQIKSTGSQDGTVTTDGETTTEDTGHSDSTATDHGTSVTKGTSTGESKGTGQQANGIGTIDAGFDPVTVAKASMIVSDSNVNGSTNTFKNNDDNTTTTDSTNTNTSDTKSSGKGTSTGKSVSESGSKSDTDVTGGNKANNANTNDTHVQGAVVSKLDLQLKYINAFRNINKEFVDNAWTLFQSTYI